VRRLAILLVLAACRKTPDASPQPPVDATPKPVIPVSSLAEIVAAIVPVERGAAAITLDRGDAIAVCRDAGYPEVLPASAASRITDHPPGSSAIIVHAAGNSVVEIASVGCEPPGDIDEAKVRLELREPAPTGPMAAQKSALVGITFVVPPHLAVFDAKVADTATLVVPAQVDMRAPIAAPWRAAAKAHLEARAEKTFAQWCGNDEEREATRAALAAMPAAIDGAIANVVQADGGALGFVVIEDPQVAFSCSGVPTGVALLVDGKGEILHEIESNNGITLGWVVDLDGDGTDEAVIDVKQLEDGGHQIVLLHRVDGAWDDTTLWSSPSP
jgi:hypothetical protein